MGSSNYTRTSYLMALFTERYTRHKKPYILASDQLPLFVVPKNTVTDLPRYDALLSHFTCQIYLATMSRLSIGFEYESPLPRSPSLISASCSSGQWFAIDFLQTPRYRDALIELLALPLQRVSRGLSPLE